MSARTEWIIAAIVIALLFPGLLILIPAVALPVGIVAGLGWLLWAGMKGSVKAARSASARRSWEREAEQRRRGEVYRLANMPKPETDSDRLRKLQQKYEADLKHIDSLPLQADERHAMRQRREHIFLQQAAQYLGF